MCPEGCRQYSCVELAGDTGIAQPIASLWLFGTGVPAGRQLPLLPPFSLDDSTVSSAVHQGQWSQSQVTWDAMPAAFPETLFALFFWAQLGMWLRVASGGSSDMQWAL